MKFIVDKMPEEESKCVFAEWKPNPPFIEEVGRWVCKFDNARCDLCKNECRVMKDVSKHG